MRVKNNVIFKELHFVYIVNGKKFLKKSDAEAYMVKEKVKEIESRIDFSSEHI